MNQVDPTPMAGAVWRHQPPLLQPSSGEGLPRSRRLTSSWEAGSGSLKREDSLEHLNALAPVPKRTNQLVGTSALFSSFTTSQGPMVPSALRLPPRGAHCRRRSDGHGPPSRRCCHRTQQALGVGRRESRTSATCSWWLAFGVSEEAEVEVVAPLQELRRCSETQAVGHQRPYVPPWIVARGGGSRELLSRLNWCSEATLEP